MSEYTPSTEEVREQFWTASGTRRRDSEAWGEFDRWLAAHDAEARARAVTDCLNEVRMIPCWAPDGDRDGGEFDLDGESHRRFVLKRLAEVRAGVVAEEPEGRIQFTAAYRAANGNVISLETPNMLREAAEKTVREFSEEDPEGPEYFVATRILPPWVPVKQEGAET